MLPKDFNKKLLVGYFLKLTFSKDYFKNQYFLGERRLRPWRSFSRQKYQDAAVTARLITMMVTRMPVTAAATTPRPPQPPPATPPASNLPS